MIKDFLAWCRKLLSDDASLAEAPLVGVHHPIPEDLEPAPWWTDDPVMKMYKARRYYVCDWCSSVYFVPRMYLPFRCSFCTQVVKE